MYYQPEPVEGGNAARITLKGIIRTVAAISADIGGAASGYVGGSLKGAAGKAAGDKSPLYQDAKPQVIHLLAYIP